VKSTGSRLTAAMRAGEWWEYKIAPILAIFYATSLLASESILAVAPSLLLLLAALVPGAVYVSVLNDLTDRDEDRRAGKANRMAGAPLWFAWAAIAPAVAAGLAIAWSWRDDPLLSGCYLAAWTAFTLYSLPPFRLKTRGLAGLVADASGAHLFPTLVAVLLAFRASGKPVDVLWLVAVGSWAFAHGLRGILWHQLLDSEADRVAGVRTFVQRVTRPRAVALGHYLAWPVELAALVLLLWKLGLAAPPIALLLYGLLVRQRLRIFRMRAIVVEPHPRYLLLLQEYYILFLPVALLVEAALRRPADALVLLVHLALFPISLARVARDSWKLRRSGFLPTLRTR
jgi:hypothetical protein